MIDSCNENDLETLTISLCLTNQRLSQMSIPKDNVTVYVYENVTNPENSFLKIRVINVSLLFEMDFNLHSKPEWFRDQGNGSVNVKDFNISLNLQPYNQDGSLQMDFSDAIVEITDFDAKFDG